MYSPFIMVGSENMNMSFDTHLARLSIKEMNMTPNRVKYYQED